LATAALARVAAVLLCKAMVRAGALWVVRVEGAALIKVSAVTGVALVVARLNLEAAQTLRHRVDAVENLRQLVATAPFPSLMAAVHRHTGRRRVHLKRTSPATDPQQHVRVTETTLRVQRQRP
jgi:hypothetical protein